MRRTNLYLDDAQTNVLDEMARQQGTSRAELVRRILDRSIQETPADLEADLKAIEDSFGILGEGRFPERGSDERAAYLDRVRGT